MNGRDSAPRCPVILWLPSLWGLKICIVGSPRRMEPQGCERHRWAKPRGRNERAVSESIHPVADKMPVPPR
jgi:hypothetical protein